MQSISIQALANQQLQCQLGTQAVTLNIYQFQYGLFMDVLISGNVILSGVICQNLNRIIRDSYLGFVGDLIWVDTQGTSDPVFTGLGARWQLVYLSQSDLTALNLSG